VVREPGQGWAYMLMCDGSVQCVKEAGFREDKGQQRGAITELKAVQRFQIGQKEELREYRGGRVVWKTDSYACATYLKRGARYPEVQKEVVRIKFLEKELGVQVVGVWESEDVGTAELCQKLSRSTDEWGVDRKELARIFAKWGVMPEVDCMASRSSNICKRFFAKGQSSRAEGQDMFAQKLEAGVVYF
jgi:hypothetical protein